ncbi:hypothetical protein [Mycobacterium sp. 1245805.9]|uniref:hypothetical protein n=1 Tax=Mycobacterium sp. 1245805.9 TaxID=1856862 RepID=UPI0007FD5A28|nr:hypothetical protein [Mycobacterium sp. 1245805.9]OBI92965.1 hypothetical protein A9X00_14750 [Mycobacterium sp. 1245805.9]
MLASPTGLTGTTDPVPQRTSPSVEVPSTDVLISTQQVVFGTVAALAKRRDADRPRRHYPRRYGFLENALMAREMERL